MKAFILAAGNGERLRPLTGTIPKCLVPVKGVPLLAIWLELCCRHGIGEVLVNTHSHAKAVRDFLGLYSGNLKVHIAHEESLLGSAGTLLANRRWIGSDEDFWVLYGDVLTNMDLTGMLALHRAKGQIATMGVHTVDDPSQCGIVTVDESQNVQGFTEKPSRPMNNLAFSGILAAASGIFDEIPKRVPADLGFHVLPNLVGRMSAYVVRDYLIDVGSPASYRDAQLSWPGLDCSSAREHYGN
ncbi:MAG TPA: nucleotidyltransferase family protein [Candidatus Saccharimonadales bacterium]|nr:nucleotidyltransferase family protein [Candidatus Saccharimonadales bacterium]